MPISWGHAAAAGGRALAAAIFSVFDMYSYIVSLLAYKILKLLTVEKTKLFSFENLLHCFWRTLYIKEWKRPSSSAVFKIITRLHPHSRCDRSRPPVRRSPVELHQEPGARVPLLPPLDRNLDRNHRTDCGSIPGWFCFYERLKKRC